MVWMLVVMNWWRFRKSNTENGKKMRTCRIIDLE